MNEHIVKAYDKELGNLHSLIHHMGELTIVQIQKAIHSLVERDGKLAQEVITHDYDIDLLEMKVDELSVRILALRQPVALDLRTVIAALKIANQIERIADYASNIAKRTLELIELPPHPLVEGLPALVEIPQKMIKDGLKAFETKNLELAFEVWAMDKEVDDVYHVYLMKLFNEMITEPQHIRHCTELLFAAKNIERIGDQAQNIAEAAYTMLTGKPFKESDYYKNATQV